MAQTNQKQPSFQILICLIKIWDPADSKNLLVAPDNAMLITECEEIEIEESYKKLIGTASVKFPRGTVIRKTVTKQNEQDVAQAKELQASISDSGVVEETRLQTSVVASPANFKTGQRIRIYLGYTTDPEVARMAKINNIDPKSSIYYSTQNLKRYESEYKQQRDLHLMFDGYITQISVDSPVELHCENLASGLKTVTCQQRTVKSKNTLKALFSDEKGCLNMLQNTGLTIHPVSMAQNFDLGQIDLNPEWTVADVLTKWAQYGVNSFVTEYDGKPVIAVGRSYFSDAKKDSIVQINSQSAEPVKILFDYHVASNGLSLLSTDKKFLAVEAEGLGVDEKFFHITILRNPKYKANDPSTGKPYRILNESKLSKKAIKLGLSPISKSTEKVQMNLYTVIPYHSRHIPVTRDDLMAEAIKYLESYNMNGIEGDLTLFGDLHLHTATEVHLIDDRFPGKNGYYLVDEVHTIFGTRGYRQTIKLPYCIKRDKQDKKQ